MFWTNILIFLSLCQIYNFFVIHTDKYIENLAFPDTMCRKCCINFCVSNYLQSNSKNFINFVCVCVCSSMLYYRFGLLSVHFIVALKRVVMTSELRPCTKWDTLPSFCQSWTQHHMLYAATTMVMMQLKIKTKPGFVTFADTIKWILM